MPREQPGRGLPALPTMVAYERPRRDIGFHFVDQVAREAKAVAGIDAITANSYTVRSTINPQLQRAVEEALQEGLWRYERSAGRAAVPGGRSQPGAGGQAHRSRQARQEARRQAAGLAAGAREGAAAALRRALDAGCGGGEAHAARRAKPGGSVLPTAASCRFAIDNAAAQRKLVLHDVVFVRVTEGKGKTRRAPSCGCARWCRERWWSWRTRPAASSP